MKKYQKWIQYGLASLILSISGAFSTQVLKVDSTQRMKAKISFDSMNRMAFLNDRIVQIFGDEETFTTQTDEERGQVFLKPTENNKEKSINITIATESGLVQDMELIPEKINTQTILFKNQSSDQSLEQPDKKIASLSSSHLMMNHDFNYLSRQAPSFHRQGIDRTSHMIKLIKSVLMQGDQLSDNTGSSPEKIENEELQRLKIKADPLYSRMDDVYEAGVYEVINTSDQEVEVFESMMKGPRVMAVTLLKRTLKPNEKSRMVVVRQKYDHAGSF